MDVRTTLARVRNAFHEYTLPFRGYFIRFLDGDTLNCSAANLCYVHPYDAFTHPEWAVDWDCALMEHSDQPEHDIAFVKANMGNFAKLYEKRAKKRKQKQATKQAKKKAKR